MKLALYILREHLAPFCLSLFLITFLFIIDFMVKLLDAILSKGLDFLVITELFFLNMAWMLALSVPMSCLVASLLAFGRLSADNEIMALRANGISPLKILFPVLLAGTVVCVALVLFNNYVLPEANHRAAALKSDITRQKAPAFITPRVLIKDFQNYRIWVDSIDYDNNFLFGVKIYSWEGQQPPRYMTASKALMEYTPDGSKMLIHLQEGENHVVDTKNTNRYLRIQFHSQTVAIDNVDASLVRRDRNYRSDREMTMGQMLEVVERARFQRIHNDTTYPPIVFEYMEELDSLLQEDSLLADTIGTLAPRLLASNWWEVRPVPPEAYRKTISQEQEKKREASRYTRKQRGERKREYKYLVEFHKKLSIPVACILFVIVGGSLGMTSHKGSLWVGVLISCGCFLLYWICLLRGEAMADKLEIKPWLAMWFSNILVGIFSIVFLIRSVVLLRK